EVRRGFASATHDRIDKEISVNVAAILLLLSVLQEQEDPINKMIFDAPPDISKVAPAEQTYWLGRFRSQFGDGSVAPAARGTIGCTLARWHSQMNQGETALAVWRS